MGIWEWLGLAAKSVKEKAPDAVKNGCQATCDYGSAAVKRITNNADQWTPDQETRSNVSLYTTKFAKNAGIYAVKEGYKIIPGGSAVHKIVTDTMSDVKHEKLILDQKLKAIEDKLEQTIDQHSNAAPKRSDPVEIVGGSGVKPAPKTPQDVIKARL